MEIRKQQIIRYIYNFDFDLDRKSTYHLPLYMTRSEAMNIYVTLNENKMLIHATLWLNSMFGFLITETNIHTDETVM